MTTIKEKAKNYWEDNKTKIIVSGVTVAAIGVGSIAYKAYGNGFVDGGMIGFRLAIEWFEQTFPGESNARELYERYAKEHPEDLVHRTGFGKWSH